MKSKGVVTGFCREQGPGCLIMASGPRSQYCDVCRQMVKRHQDKRGKEAERRRKGVLPAVVYDVCQRCGNRPPRPPKHPGHPTKFCEWCVSNVELESRRIRYREKIAIRDDNLRERLHQLVSELVAMLDKDSYDANRLHKWGRLLAQVSIDPVRNPRIGRKKP